MFGRFVGTKKPVDTTPKAPIDTTNLTNHINSLDAKEAAVSQKIRDIDNQITELKQKMRTRGPNYNYYRQQATNLLQKRKIYEKQLRSVSNMNLTMNQTQMTIEGLQMMQDQYNVMKEMSSAQSEMFKTVNIDDFISMSDKMQDMREDMDDVQEMLSEAMVGDIEYDEDELDRELAAYAAEDMPVASSSLAPQPVAAPATSGPIMPELPAYNLNDDLSRL